MCYDNQFAVERRSTEMAILGRSHWEETGEGKDSESDRGGKEQIIGTKKQYPTLMCSRTRDDAVLEYMRATDEVIEAVGIGVAKMAHHAAPAKAVNKRLSRPPAPCTHWDRSGVAQLLNLGTWHVLRELVRLTLFPSLSKRRWKYLR